MQYRDILIIALSATIISNVLKYIHKSFYLRMLVHMFKQTLGWPNITYMIKKIKQKGFKDLDVLVL